MDWFRVTYFVDGSLFHEVDVQARDAEHAFEVSYWDSLRAQHAAASLPANLTYSAKPIGDPLGRKPTPWSDQPDPNTPPKNRGEWLGAILARCMLVFISLMILGLCAASWFPVSAVQP